MRIAERAMEIINEAANGHKVNGIPSDIKELADELENEGCIQSVVNIRDGVGSGAIDVMSLKGKKLRLLVKYGEEVTVTGGKRFNNLYKLFDFLERF